MSAIWGVIDLENDKIEKEIILNMTHSYDEYKIDSISTYEEAGSFFGFGNQIVTQEAKYERLPLTDQEIVFDADVIIDNREELLNQLKVDKKKRSTYPDSAILYAMLRKFGIDGLLSIYGIYSFALYNSKKKEIMLGVDPLGSRVLYYYMKNEKLFFSTLQKAIHKANADKIKLNYNWIADYLAQNNLGIFTECEPTYLEDVYRVPPGTILIINKEGIIRKEYYKPLEHIKVDKKKSDEEYKKEFNQIFQTSVEQTLRSTKNTGIMLSGGLDSSSVACFASAGLNKKNEKLYSFTSIPIANYQSNKWSPNQVNETIAIETMKKYLGNLVPTYIDIPECNAWDGSIELMEKLELPFKTLQNIKWMYACLEAAADKNCKILLTGQYGNLTISHGSFQTYYNTLLKKGKLFTLLKEINIRQKKIGSSRKRIYKRILLENRPKFLVKKESFAQLFDSVYINPELITRYHVEERIRKQGHIASRYIGEDIKQVHKGVVDKNSLVHLGDIETKFSLSTGVIMRDPTRDRRVIEFCLNLPENQFVSGATERCLVRKYLKDRVPYEIRDQIWSKGLQSADINKRLELNWNNIYKEIYKALESPMAKSLLDVEKLASELKKYKDTLPEEYDFNLVKIMYSVLLVKFLENITVDMQMQQKII